MRRSLVLPLLLLAPLACSDDDGGSASGSAVGSFCDQVEDVSAEVERAGADLGDDPTEAVSLLRDLSRQLGEIDPPPAIDDAWQLYVDGTADFADTLDGVEPGDNVGATEALVEFARTHGEAIKEAGRVASFVDDECGVSFAGPLNP